MEEEKFCIVERNSKQALVVLKRLLLTQGQVMGKLSL
jgi:hypothetical protein